MKKLMFVAFVCLNVACSTANPSAPTQVVKGAQAVQNYPIGTYVPGTANLWLAGMPDGTRAGARFPGGEMVDVAPAQSPVFVTLEVGKSYDYEVGFGCVGNGPETGCSDANGNGELWPHLGGTENGIKSLNAPLHSLIGLFAGSDQPFFLGKSGVLVATASRLYLGVQDGWEWNNNTGQHAVKFYEK